MRDMACYGNGHQSFIDANCSDTENIYPIRLIAGAKPSSSGCPAEMEWDAPDALVQQCCVPDSDQDCQAPVNTYVPDGASNYLDTCVGRTMCRKRPAFRMDVLKINTCNSSIYPPQTHYLYLDYNCIPGSSIGRFPYVNETNDGSGSILYLQGSEYPEMTSVTSMTCSVETNCFETIVVYGLHVSFHLDNLTCNQAMVLSDTSGTLYTISCSDNDTSTGYRRRTLATSTTNYMELHYNSAAINQSLFWLAFKSAGNLTIDCPRQEPKGHCIQKPTPESTKDYTIYIIIGAVIILFVVASASIIIYVCKRKPNCRNPNNGQPPTTSRDVQIQTRCFERVA